MSNRAPEQETASEALRRVRDRLRAAAIEDAGVEAALLLRQALRPAGEELPSQAWLYHRIDQPLGASEQTVLETLLVRRLGGEPSAYITGVREFRGLDFEVTPDVLIPRPETELLVEHAVAWTRQNFLQGASPVIADIGTGSGEIAVTLARDLPAATIIATDVSWGALAVARRNARRHGVDARISFRHGDLLLPADRYVDLIVANLPYVPSREWQSLAPDVSAHEPPVALLGGEDGLDLIRALLRQAPRYLRAGGAVYLEFGAGQEAALRASASRLVTGAGMESYEDFAGIPRVMAVRP